MGYTIKQKIGICLKSESNPEMTQADLALWAMKEYGSEKPPSQTTISRILHSKNDIISRKESEFELIRRRKRANPLLRRILTEWITQAVWENLPMTTPIIQSTANGIWTRLPKEGKDGNGVFNQKWCSHFIKKLNINITGTPQEVLNNRGYPLNKVWKLDEILELKKYLREIVAQDGYAPQDVFVLDDFQLFYSLPLDQIFDVSSIDKGIKQTNTASEYSLTIMLGCNIDGSEKLSPIIVGKYDKFDVSKSSHASLNSLHFDNVSYQNLMNKLTEVYNIMYKSNTNKWITSSMFQNYLIMLDHKLSTARPNGRKILILLDDCSSHRVINLKFNNIRLVYLKNEANHKNPYNITYSGVKFDYLPMSFGLVEEFKILYRMQQYLEMINLQRNISSGGRSNGAEDLTTENIDSAAAQNILVPSLEVLSSSHYHIALIKAIEWITRSWHSISQERIFSSWKKTHLFNLLDWPTGNPRQLAPLNELLSRFDESKSYRKLQEIMGYLNVVIPWETEELVGLVNERSKVTLSYASLDEIIDSCLLEPVDQYDEHEDDVKYDAMNGNHYTTTTATDLVANDPWFSVTAMNNMGDNQFLFNRGDDDTDMKDIDPLPQDNNPVIAAFENVAFPDVNVLNSVTTGSIDSLPSQKSSPNFDTMNGYPNNPLKHKLSTIESWDDSKRNHSQDHHQQSQQQKQQVQQQQQPATQQDMSGYGFSPVSNGNSPVNGSLPQTSPQFSNGTRYDSFDSNQTPLYVNNISQPQQQQVQQQPQQAPPLRPQPPSIPRQVSVNTTTDLEMVATIRKILEYSASNTLKLSQSTIDDLEYNLRVIQARINQV
ncbi:Protein PDC2 [Candida viswanathii]|uniref:Protein PDC2 n=1 Tax=Candida viswanathii TaxID=5486 RepID=A0A367YFJ5_9ASCO|nr:Protein PDC2 [Candida viswanathii]